MVANLIGLGTTVGPWWESLQGKPVHQRTLENARLSDFQRRFFKAPGTPLVGLEEIYFHGPLQKKRWKMREMWKPLGLGDLPMATGLEKKHVKKKRKEPPPPTYRPDPSSFLPSLPGHWFHCSHNGNREMGRRSAAEVSEELHLGERSDQRRGRLEVWEDSNASNFPVFKCIILFGWGIQ